MAKQGDRQPIIIKRVKKHGHGHHGGAWKIAYADFVTAMMAFFLLMWLLGSTTKGDLQGISDYFRTPLKVALTGGSGAGETSSVIQGGSMGFTQTNSEARSKSSAMQRAQLSEKDAKEMARAAERRRLQRLKEQVEDLMVKSPNLEKFRSQIRLDITSEGLRIQIVDDQARPMFDLGSAVVKEYMRQILWEIGKVLNTVDHRVTLSGHTDAKRYATGERGYSNWELSSDRANASRRELIAGGMDEAKILRVMGVGTSVMLNPADPNDPVNRRISIIVMNKDTEAKVLRDMGAVDVKDAEELEQEIRGRSEGAPASAGVQPNAERSPAGEQSNGDQSPAEDRRATSPAGRRG